MEYETPKPDAQAIIEAVQSLTRPETFKPDTCSDARFAIYGGGQRLEDISAAIESQRPQPYRLKGHVSLHSAVSLAAYVMRYEALALAEGNHPAIYADRSHLRFVAIMNAHGTEEIGWSDWCASYDLRPSRERTIWQEFADGWHDQSEFANFLEDSALDLAPPPMGDSVLASTVRQFASSIGATFAQPNDVLQVARSLEVHQTARIQSVRRRQDGTASIQFVTEQHDVDGAPLSVPKLFAIMIPLFEHGPRHFLPVLLKYRASEQGIRFGIELPMVERAVDEAFHAIGDDLQEQIRMHDLTELEENGGPANDRYADYFFFGSPFTRT